MKKLLTFLLSCILIATFACCGATNSEAWQEQYDLAIKLLDEGNYEEAIIAFTKAIEIDSKSAESYAGRAEAYLRLAEITQDAEKAKEYYENAFEDYQKATDYGYEAAEAKQQSVENLIKAIDEGASNEGLLKPLYDTFVKNDIEAVVALMKSPEYNKLKDMTAPYWIYGEDNGNKLLVYADGHCYYGGFSAGIRAGNGIWVETEATEKTQESHLEWQMYNGGWSNDLPNGEGVINVTLSAEEQAGLYDIYPLKKEIRGSFINGIYDGEINKIWNMCNGEVFVWSAITAENGVYKEINVESLMPGKYAISTTGDEMDVVLHSDGSVQYVFGFEK